MSGRTQLPSGLVTFMFTDIEGSTRLARLLGSGYAAVLGDHRRVLRRTLSDFGGTELFTEGDSFFVAFADAEAALRAGVDAQRALAAHDWPRPDATPRVRMGVHTGWAEPVAGEYASIEVHRAARIAAAAHGGQLLCSAATTRYASLPPDAGLLDLGSYRLRGFDDRERLFQLVAPGLESRFPRPRTAAAAEHNLPAQVTSFVGRRRECTTVAGLLRDHRLVTVVGAGGMGKTRLALRVAEGLRGAFPNGVWFVDLASIGDADQVVVAVAAALGLRPEPGRPLIDTVVDHASTRRLLLVLDTCDAHPTPAAALALRLLAGAPGATVLATSREPLAAHGELVWRLSPLSLRDGSDGALPDAVALLTDRVAAARGGRPVFPAELAGLREVASKLDGLPLAIELAAVRLRAVSAGQFAARLHNLPRALDAGRARPVDDPAPERRHDSLAATVAWSYRTLPAGAERLLGGLAVFAGPVDLPIVEWVGGDDVLEHLSVLVDKSLVEVVGDPAGRCYRIAAPTRGYALARLAADGSDRAARDRHVAWALHALHGIRVTPDGRPRTLSLTALAPFVEEWRTALSWTTTGGDAHRGLTLAQGLDPWWREHGYSAEARLWLDRLCARSATTGDRMPKAALAAAYLMQAGHADDSRLRAELLDRAETLAWRVDDPELLIRVLARRPLALVEDGRPDEAERVCRNVIRRAERLGVSEAALPAVVCLAELCFRRGAHHDAAELLGAARQSEAGNWELRGRRAVDMLLGVVALRRGDLVAAHDHLVVALRSRMQCGFRGEAAETVNAIAARCGLGGDLATAAMLFGAGKAASGAGGFGDFWAEQQALLRARVGDAVFDAAYAAGTRLDLDQAAAVALAVDHPDLAAGSSRFDAAAGSRAGSPPARTPR